jgi:glycosyltransferase involved in cell wall biosynthesis
VADEPSERVRVLVVPAGPPRTGGGDYAALLARELDGRDGIEASAGPAGRADVVVLNEAPYAHGVALGWLRSARRARRLGDGRRLVAVLHEVFERGDSRLRMRLLERAHRWSAATIAAAADAVVVSDPARARRLSRLVPGVARPTVVPVGPNVPVPAEAPRRARSEIVCSFGLLQARRDLETLVQAAALLRRTRPGATFVLVGDLDGDPARRASLAALAARLEAPVTFTGSLPAAEVSAALAGAAVFVSPYTDAVSLGSGTLAAALAHALPVVVFEDVELHPALVPGSTVLTAPRSAEGLARVLDAALGPEADAVGAAGRALYERELSWQAIGDRFVELLRRA